MGAPGSGKEKVVSDWLRDAIYRVHSEQPELWEWGLGERTRVGQIFRALYETDPFLGGWDIDLEWNREGVHGGPKPQPENSSGYGTPDIAVHHRGKTGPEHNLLIVEFKNALSHGGTNNRDRRKVRWWMAQYSYRFGAVIALGPTLKRFGPTGIWLTLDESGKPIEQPWHWRPGCNSPLDAEPPRELRVAAVADGLPRAAGPWSGAAWPAPGAGLDGGGLLRLGQDHLQAVVGVISPGR